MFRVEYGGLRYMTNAPTYLLAATKVKGYIGS